MEGITSLLIENRMREMGYDKFHFEIVKHTVNNSTLDISAHNEFWYLFDVSQVDDSFTITCDNDVIKDTDFHVDNVPYAPHELTGSIIIDNVGGAADQTFLFYRVVPE